LYHPATSSKDDIHRRIGGLCQSHHTKVIFKVFGGDTEAQKTTTTSTTSSTQQPRTRAPPRIDWESPGNAWRNHHNDEPYGDHRQTAEIQPPQYGNRINHAHPSTQRPLFVSNGGGGAGTSGFTVNKPTKKTSEFWVICGSSSF
jgi:hypothetical protein